jgi:hypothetical protein
MNQTGVTSVGSRRQARKKRSFIAVRHGRAQAGRQGLVRHAPPALARERWATHGCRRGLIPIPIAA